MMVRKAGAAVSMSSQLISRSVDIIKQPTRISAGAVEVLGMIPIHGVNSIEIKKHKPTIAALNPERPPAAIPAALSI